MNKIDIKVFIETVEIPPRLGKNIKVFSIQHDFSNGILENVFSVSKIKGIVYRYYQLKSIRRTYAIFCNSNYTLNQLTSIFPSKTNVYVAPHSCDEIFEKGTIDYNLNPDKFKTLPSNYFLFVGRITVKHKNIPLLLKSFLDFSKVNNDVSLVIATTEEPNSTEITLLLELGDKVIFFKQLSTLEITYLYTHALAFVFPSFYEGFGVPILEAQHMECPLILNDIPVFREVSGNCAIFFNGTSEDLIKAMKNVMNHQKRNHIIDCGKKNASKYSWRKTSTVILDKIMELKLYE